jgi:hypothetical protein
MPDLLVRAVLRDSGALALVGLFSLSSIVSAQGPLGPFGPNSVNWPIAAGGNGHIYEPVAVTGPITWTAANQAAIAAGGYLVTVLSAAENSFVFGVINAPQYWDLAGGWRGPWLGGRQKPNSPEPAGGWTWSTGEPFTYTNWSTAGHLNNGLCGNEGENCAQFLGGQDPPMTFPLPLTASNWNDRADDSSPCAPLGAGVRGYVVEYDVELRCPCTPTGLCAENPPPNNVCAGGAFTLCVARLSNGSARLQVFNLPIGTAYGKVLISTVPAFPVGSGAFFGLNFDLTLLVPILFSSFAVGDPLSWLIAAPGFSPEQPFFVPAGTMSPFAGQTWDLVAVAVVPGATGLTYTLSSYVQRTWP